MDHPSGQNVDRHLEPTHKHKIYIYVFLDSKERLYKIEKIGQEFKITL